MRLPRSIAPSQWLEFLESHLTLFLATLEAQGINIRTSVNVEDAPRNDVAERTRAGHRADGRDQRGAWPTSSRRPRRAPAKAPPNAPVPVRLEDIFESIDAGSLTEAEKYLRGIDAEAYPEGAGQRGLVAPRPGLPEQSREQAGDGGLPARARTQPGKSPGLVQRRHDPARGRACSTPRCNVTCARSSSTRSSRRSGATSARCNFSSANSSSRSIRSTARSGSSPTTRARGTISPVRFARWTSLTEAERCCHRALNFKPDYADPSFKLGTIYFQQGRMEEAEKAFRKVLEVEPRLSAGGALSRHGAGADQSPEGRARGLRNGGHAAGRDGTALAGLERNGLPSLRARRVRRRRSALTRRR